MLIRSTLWSNIPVNSPILMKKAAPQLTWSSPWSQAYTRGCWKNLFHKPFPQDTFLTVTLLLQVFLATCFAVWEGSSQVKTLQGNERLRILQSSWHMNIAGSSKILWDAQRWHFSKFGRGFRVWMFNRHQGAFDGRGGRCNAWINTATKREQEVTLNSISRWRCGITPFMAKMWRFP